jgi:cysteine desulfurase
MKTIYMDHHATTPLDPRVLKAMMPFLEEHFGNPASITHSYGWAANDAVDLARTQIAALIGAKSKEILFTSGATESDNLAILGSAFALREQGNRRSRAKPSSEGNRRSRGSRAIPHSEGNRRSRHSTAIPPREGNHIITSQAEHKAVLESCRYLNKEGFDVTFLPVDQYGSVDPDSVKNAITPKTILISIMFANGEIGTIHDISAIGGIAREQGILFHCDAVQGIGRVQVDVEELKVDLMSISGHKIYGPKGIGALYVRKRLPRIRLRPILRGGGQEQGMRSGTLNVPGIVGLGKACEVAAEVLTREGVFLKGLRDRLYKGILENLDGIHLNGHPEKRLPGNLNLSFDSVEGESLLLGLKDIAVSSGSACTSASREPSYVLKAMGLSDELAYSSIRFGLGRFNTEEEVDYVIREVVERTKALRQMSRHFEKTKATV